MCYVMATQLTEKPPHFSPIGTFIRDIWTKDYYRQVLRIERVSNHKICGAPKKNLTPCRSYPKEQYSYYCSIHKPDLTTKGNNTTSDLPSNNPNRIGDQIASQHRGLENYEKEKGIFQPQMSLTYLRRTFAKCNNCLVRADCVQNIPDSHCTIEEDMFNKFLDGVRNDYDIQDFTQIDMWMIYDAAFALINRIRFQIIKQLYSPTEDNALRIEIAGVRSSKEYRECMKSLGLTRNERQKLKRKDFQIGISATKASAQISLASQMAQAKKQKLENTEQV